MINKFTIIGALLGLAVIGETGALIMLHELHHRQAVTGTAVKKTMYHCPMHPNYFSDTPGTCPICGMKLVPVNGAAPDLEAGVVKIDPTVEQNIGVTTETATIRDLTRDIRASTTIELNETAISNVNTKVMGWVDKLYVDFTGQRVNKGQPLLTIYSPDLVSTQEEYLQALQYRNNLSAGSSEAGQGALDLVESSRRRLLNWDISEAQIDAVAKSGIPQKTMTIYSPAGGVVLEKTVQAGQNVTPGMELYKIGDLSTVWAVANVYQEDLPFIKIGTGAVVDVPSAMGKEFSGKVEFIAPVLDSATRTAEVRIGIRNTPDFILKPRMFANVRILSPAALQALSVSQQAILHTGKRNVAIIALGNGRFRPQEVRLGVSANGFTQIISGLSAGDSIVTSSQFLIDAESNLKQAIGAMGGGLVPAGSEGSDSARR